MSLTPEQYKAHYSGIGGSMAASILGLNQYQSNVDAYLCLTDEQYREKQSEEISAKMQVKIGNALESIVADQVEIETGWKLKQCNDTFYDKEYPFLMGHVDRLIEGEDALLEIKTRGMFGARGYGEEGSDDVQDSEYMQCMHYLMLTGLSVAHLAVLILATSEIKYFVIKRNDAVIAAMRENLIKFWNENILTKTPPTPLNYQDAGKIWANSEPKIKIADNDILLSVEKVKETKELISNLIKIEDEHKTKIATFLQEFDTLATKDGTNLLTYKTQSANRIDVGLLNATYPDVAQACSYISKSRVMRFKK